MKPNLNPGNPLLEVKWSDVRLFTVDGNKVILVTAEGQKEIEFESRGELDAAVREWFVTAES